jgi:hypothetical protein
MRERGRGREREKKRERQGERLHAPKKVEADFR